MIPLRDDVPSRTYPFVTVALILANGAAFVWELGLGREIERALYGLAVIPALFAGGDGVFGPLDVVRTTLDPAFLLRTLSAMFLHGGWAHIFSNMLYLWIFGDNVEDRMGHFRYLVFYLLCGVLASYVHVFADASSRLPSIGASGAIAGVLGAYLLLYPRARVVVAFPPPLIFFFPLIQVPAPLLLGVWFLQQFLSGALSLAETAETGGVAWWAHIGGFAAGALLVGAFQKKSRRPARRDVWWPEERYRRPRYD
jgi:membrane associated rhomboid family serine protease